MTIRFAQPESDPIFTAQGVGLDELAAAESALELLIGQKQDAATAATDAELAALDSLIADQVADLTDAISTKQDAATAATDAEVIAAIAAHAAGDATDAELAAAIAAEQTARANAIAAAVAPGGWRVVGAVGQPPYENGWGSGDTGGTYHAPQFRQEAGGIVRLRGVAARNPGSTAVIYTLPSGFRPAKFEFHLTYANTGAVTFGLLEIAPTGGIRLFTPAAIAVSFDGLTFAL